MKSEREQAGVTEALYETNGFIKEFTATVVDCSKATEDKGDLFALILDRTAFFPEGGGQQSDTGLIGDAIVSDVQINEAGNIVHYVDKCFEKGASVAGLIDFPARMARMQNHSAEHILSGLIHSMYGYDNVGFHMSEAEVRFDINGVLTKEQIDDLEAQANVVVYSNIPITVSFPTEEEARNLEYRSKLDIYENIRLVAIGDVDCCACCAPHLDTTGQIGVIKIIDYMPHRQGMRITMVAGMDALNDYTMLHENNAAIMALLSAKRDATAQYANDFMNKLQKMKEENTSLKYEMTRLISESVLARLSGRAQGDDSPEVIFTDVLDNQGLRNLINACTKQYAVPVAGFIGNDKDGYRYIISCSGDVDIRMLSGKLNEKLGGKGGGSAQMVQGSVNGTRADIEKILEAGVEK